MREIPSNVRSLSLYGNPCAATIGYRRRVLGDGDHNISRLDGVLVPAAEKRMWRGDRGAEARWGFPAAPAATEEDATEAAQEGAEDDRDSPIGASLEEYQKLMYQEGRDMLEYCLS